MARVNWKRIAWVAIFELLILGQGWFQPPQDDTLADGIAWCKSTQYGYASYAGCDQ